MFWVNKKKELERTKNNIAKMMSEESTKIAEIGNRLVDLENEFDALRDYLDVIILRGSCYRVKKK